MVLKREKRKQVKNVASGVREVKIGDVVVGGRQPLVFIAGPCVIENEKALMKSALQLKKLSQKLDLPLIFKSSYDKANRTSIKAFRGPGLKKGLRLLAKVKAEFDLPLLSDIHSKEEAKEASAVLDCLQIPAFLSRQTDLLFAAAKTGRAVNVKKGQFLAPWNMTQVIEKIEAAGNRNILLTERGACFGYNNLVVDFRALAIMRASGYPVIFDATHSTQLPGARGTSSGGEGRYAAALSRAAVAFGCDGLFLEVHERPDQAPCDGPNMMRLAHCESFLRTVQSFDELVLRRRIR